MGCTALAWVADIVAIRFSSVAAWSFVGRSTALSSADSQSMRRGMTSFRMAMVTGPSGAASSIGFAPSTSLDAMSNAHVTSGVVRRSATRRRMSNVDMGPGPAGASTGLRPDADSIPTRYWNSIQESSDTSSRCQLRFYVGRGPSTQPSSGRPTFIAGVNRVAYWQWVPSTEPLLIDDMLDRQATTPTSSSAAVMLLRQKYGSGLSRFERDNAEAMEAGQRWIAAQRKQIALLRTLKHDDHVGRRIRLAENRLDKEAAKLHEAVWANRDMRRRIDALFDEWQSLNGTAVSLSSDIETKRKEHADGSAYIANAKRTLEIAQRKMVEIEQAADRQTVRFRAGLERLAERLQTYRQRVMASTEIGDDTKCNSGPDRDAPEVVFRWHPQEQYRVSRGGRNVSNLVEQTIQSQPSRHGVICAVSIRR
ncbi:Uncharacterized protein PBTT_04673 [Plasmodiophora brassicae]|uniref:Uncharacterized protein n=1 Tax=Plasmodiophora brassicae TaxID=37360 RepID=A0A0G4IRV1_PLABS|nr:hypothetical protein PBRA_006036 [Plasmodiophora brassicae]